MKPLLALTIALAACHANDFTFPDQLEKIQSMQYRLPQKVNDVESASKQQQQQQQQFMNFLPERWANHVINIISRGITKFTLDMDRAIQNSSGNATSDNLLFSPVSLTLTLAMVLLASAGKTFDEASRILGLESGVDISRHSEVVHQIFGLLLQEAERCQRLDPSSPRTRVAFGIFVEDGYPVREQFRAIAERVYQSQIMSVDFSHNAREAKSLINEWVANKTQGKISSVLQNPPDPSTEVLIASALYFSGEWEQHFLDGATKRKAFAVEADQTVYVDMMFSGGSFPFLEDRQLGLKMIGFPYKANQITMYAVLPTRGAGSAAVAELKSRLTPELIESLIASMRNSSCIVGYPRMKLSSSLKLQRALEALGLTSLFDPGSADLSLLSPGRGNGREEKPSPSSSRPRRQSRPINQEFLDFLNSQRLPNFGLDELRNSPGGGLANPRLYAEDVLHKVEMTVNERGTEAAAATAVLLDRSGDYKRFVANRPFLFFVRHDAGKAIWFWGTINRPTPYFDSR